MTILYAKTVCKSKRTTDYQIISKTIIRGRLQLQTYLRQKHKEKVSLKNFRDMQNDHKKKGQKSITNHRLTRRVNPPGQSKEKNQSGVKFDKKYPDNFWSWTIFRGNFVLLIK